MKSLSLCDSVLFIPPSFLSSGVHPSLTNTVLSEAAAGKGGREKSPVLPLGQP